MTEPTELEKKIAERMAELAVKAAIMQKSSDNDLPDDALLNGLIANAEAPALKSILEELVERRLRIEYLGQSSITGRDSSQERID